MAQKLLIPATSTSANAVVPFSRSPSHHITNWRWNIFYKGKKNLLSDHPCTLRAPPEPYRKGSSAPAIITNGKAARPPCSSSHQLRSNKQHTDVGSFQKSPKETRIPGASTRGPGKGSAAGPGRDTAPICSAGATAARLPRLGNRLLSCTGFK